MSWYRKALYFILALATGLKLWMAATTIGSNDIKYWGIFMGYLRSNDTVSIYSSIWFYNHPPFISWFLLFLNQVTSVTSFKYFPLLFRIPAIAADVGSTLLVYKLLRLYLSERQSVIGGMVVAASPILFAVSGFHGNTDPVFIFLLLGAVFQLAAKRSPVLAGLLFGCSLNIKIVPIICLPLFLLFSPGWRQKFRFALAALLPVVAGFSYHLLCVPDAFIRQVLKYKGQTGRWGMTKVFPRITDQWILSDGYLKLTIAGLIVATCLALSVRARAVTDERGRAKALLQSLGFTFLIFLTLTPGFGVQYLSWLVPTGVFLGIAGAFLYNLIGGAFIFSVYTYWSYGFPWRYADSDLLGPWRGTAETLDAYAWGYLSVWLLCSFAAVFLFPLARKYVSRRGYVVDAGIPALAAARSAVSDNRVEVSVLPDGCSARSFGEVDRQVNADSEDGAVVFSE